MDSIYLNEKVINLYLQFTQKSNINENLNLYSFFFGSVYLDLLKATNTLSIPEAGETAETPVKRYRNTGKVPIRTQKRPYPVRNYYFLVGYIHVFDKGNSVLGGK